MVQENYPNDGGKDGQPRRSTRVDSLGSALRTLGALGDWGIVAVPSKPTMEMVRAGAVAGDISLTAARRIYEAMLRAES